MADTVCDCFSYIVASPFMALWQMFGDGMADRGRSFAEVESPFFIFGGADRLRQARVLAHVLGPGSRAGRCALRYLPASRRTARTRRNAQRILSSGIASFYR